jgi:hypothetical protein
VENAREFFQRTQRDRRWSSPAMEGGMPGTDARPDPGKNDRPAKVWPSYTRHPGESRDPAFLASESAFDYFHATGEYLRAHGMPVAFYSDKHSIFRVNTKDAASGDGVTQFGRVLTELNIDIICANSPQAKGRVERAFCTLQDRLVKELRLAGISTIEAANGWLSGFIDTYKRFSRARRRTPRICTER